MKTINHSATFDPEVIFRTEMVVTRHGGHDVLRESLTATTTSRLKPSLSSLDAAVDGLLKDKRYFRVNVIQFSLPHGIHEVSICSHDANFKKDYKTLRTLYILSSGVLK